MKIKSVLLATLLAAGATSAYAGDFVTLADNLTTLTGANGGLVNGANNSNTDKLYVETTSQTFLTGFENLIASSLTYRAFNGATTTNVGTLTLLDYHVSTDLPLDADGDVYDMGTMYDMVYRDSTDNKLVFATRFINESPEGANQEINYLYRYGFTAYSTSLAWSFQTDDDLRLYQAGRTSDSTFAASVAFDADAVRLKSDVSVDEGNPYTGLFLIKTNAEFYSFANGAVGYFQAGEEGQTPSGGVLAGFVASNAPVAPVPEPETYAMMLAGLGLVGMAARRRRKQQ